MNKKIGHLTYIIGVILAIILGLVSSWLDFNFIAWFSSVIMVLGLVAGFLNVTGEETMKFLTVSTILVIVAFVGSATTSLGSILYIGPYLKGIFETLMLFVIPATIVVGLKEVLLLSRSQ